MSVQKIFITLITIVICVILGAFVINTLMPNMVDTIISAAEGQVYRATGLSFDFNGDGKTGKTNNNGEQKGDNKDETVTDKVDGNVEGFEAQ